MPSSEEHPISNALEGIDDCPASIVGANNLQHLVFPNPSVENPRIPVLVVYLAFPKVKKITTSTT
jgi:hypothetical protein